MILKTLTCSVTLVLLAAGSVYAQSVGATYSDSPKLITGVVGEYRIESGKAVDRKYAIGPRLRDIQRLEEDRKVELMDVPEGFAKPVLFYDEERSEMDRQIRVKKKKGN